MAANQHIDLSEDNSVALVSTVIVFMALSWLSVGLRSYTRAFVMKSYQLDDWLMLIAQVCCNISCPRHPVEQLLTIPQGIFTVSCAFILEGVKEGLGRHNEAIKDDAAEVNALKVGNLQPEYLFMTNAYCISGKLWRPRLMSST